MSWPVDSFFDVWTTLTFFAVFTGALFITFIAPTNVFPGAILFPKYVEVCELRCVIFEIPINNIWGGLINGGTYGVLATAGYMGIRSIWRKKKK